MKGCFALKSAWQALNSFKSCRTNEPFYCVIKSITYKSLLNPINL